MSIKDKEWRPASSGSSFTPWKIYKSTYSYAKRLPRLLRRSIPLYVLLSIIVFFFWSRNILSPASSQQSTTAHLASLLQRELRFNPESISGSIIPRKIWQTWKTDPLHYAERDLTTARSWTDLNPSYRYEALTDDNALAWVEHNFGPAGENRLDVVYMYRHLALPIIKADFLRYLVMYIEGGIYADIDVEAIRPIDRFIPDRFHESDVDLVIGIEIDEPKFAKHEILGQKCMSFCQWTFAAKPRQKVMMRLIDGIISWLNDESEKQGKPINYITLSFDDVLSGTGPSAFTGAVLAEMSAKTGKEVTWSAFHAMPESKLVGGILVLTVEAFCAGQGHSDAGNHGSRNALVKHHYHASLWPTQHPRYKHPALGEVEKCNWDVECIRKWDEAKVAYELLSPEQQALKIKEREDMLKEQEETEAKLARLGAIEAEIKDKALREFGEQERLAKEAELTETTPETVEEGEAREAVEKEEIMEAAEAEIIEGVRVMEAEEKEKREEELKG